MYLAFFQYPIYKVLGSLSPSGASGRPCWIWGAQKKGWFVGFQPNFHSYKMRCFCIGRCMLVAALGGRQESCVQSKFFPIQWVYINLFSNTLLSVTGAWFGRRTRRRWSSGTCFFSFKFGNFDPLESYSVFFCLNPKPRNSSELRARKAKTMAWSIHPRPMMANWFGAKRVLWK